MTIDIDKERADFEAWFDAWNDPHVGMVETRIKKPAARAAWIEAKSRAAIPQVSAAELPSELALNTSHKLCHEAANAFWAYWNENGETHKRGYYESTWGAINRAIRLVGVKPHNYGTLYPQTAPSEANSAPATTDQKEQ